MWSVKRVRGLYGVVVDQASDQHELNFEVLITNAAKPGVSYTTVIAFDCISKYSKTCLKRTPYIPETWTNGK